MSLGNFVKINNLKTYLKWDIPPAYVVMISYEKSMIAELHDSRLLYLSSTEKLSEFFLIFWEKQKFRGSSNINQSLHESWRSKLCSSSNFPKNSNNTIKDVDKKIHSFLPNRTISQNYHTNDHKTLNLYLKKINRQYSPKGWNVKASGW